MEKRPSLIFCIMMDAIGCATYFLPIVGEWLDVAWAPLSAYLFYRTFGGKIGKVGAIVNLVEEMFPFIDFIPSYLLGYLYVRFSQSKKTKSIENESGILNK